MVALNLFGKAKLQKSTRKFLYTIQKTQNIYTDIWIDYGEGIGFEDTDEDTVFWMSYPKPPKEVQDDSKI